MSQLTELGVKWQEDQISVMQSAKHSYFSSPMFDHHVGSSTLHIAKKSEVINA